ncbi:MAG TPA: CBS domain-containing protein [Candidatus Saccharimonadales bacterium]|nr:CBS domain-containing protein [Candidatus Saccharimonadales bacterium]
MTNIILAIVFLLLALLGIVVRKTYYYLPARELKRRASKQDRIASQLYRAVAYGSSLRTMLWLYIGLTSAASLILLARLLPIWISLLIVGPLLWIAFSLIPATRSTKFGIRLTMFLTPFVAWLLNYLHPILSRGSEAVAKRVNVKEHTGMFERQDLIELVEQQGRQRDNRLTDEELEIVRRALKFDDYKVSQIMTPRKSVKFVLASDTVGPILIDEIHKSGQAYVLVRKTNKGEFVGSLWLQKLSLGSHGQVSDIMDPVLYYLHENDALGQALHAFFVTNCLLFVVINSFEEFVGVLTIKDVLKQLLGHMPGEDFDQYTNLTTVAARHVKTKQTDKSDKIAAT